MCNGDDEFRLNPPFSNLAEAISGDDQQSQAKPKQKSSIVSLILIIIVFIAGLSLLLYPLVSDLYNTWVHDSMIASYDEEVSKIPAADYSEWFAKAENYNARLIGQGVPDAFAVHEKTEDEDYTSQLSFRDDGMMGYIVIPRIDVNLPIYHYTSDESMQKGVGHLQGSALPVGGASTHCVLSAHRGLPSAAMFTDLDQLQVGDRFYLKVLDRTCAYQIDQVKVVEPDDTSDLDVTQGEDYCTLVTCTPYGVNSHRLLVRGHRIEYDPADEASDSANATHGPYTNYAIWIFASLAIVALFAIILMKHNRDKQEHERLKEKHGYNSTHG